jgi:hypothetical protein
MQQILRENQELEADLNQTFNEKQELQKRQSEFIEY